MLGLHTIVRDSPLLNVLVRLCFRRRFTLLEALTTTFYRESIESSIQPDLKFAYSHDETVIMSIDALDQVAPNIMFFYGLLLFLVLDVIRFPKDFYLQHSQTFQQLESHRIISRVFLFVGGIWSLQNFVV